MHDPIRETGDRRVVGDDDGEGAELAVDALDGREDGDAGADTSLDKYVFAS